MSVATLAYTCATDSFDTIWSGRQGRTVPVLDESTLEWRGSGFEFHNYLSAKGTLKPWLVRTNHAQTGATHSATVPTVIKDTTGIPKTMLILQDRGPLGSVLEFPAGKTEAKHANSEVAAYTELDEETGLRVGENGVTKISTIWCLGDSVDADGKSAKDPGCTGNTDAPYTLLVEMDRELVVEDLHPELQPGEIAQGLKSIVVPWADLPEFVNHCISKGNARIAETNDPTQGVSIDASVAHAVQTMETMRRFGWMAGTGATVSGSTIGDVTTA